MILEASLLIGSSLGILLASYLASFLAISIQDCDLLSYHCPAVSLAKFLTSFCLPMASRLSSDVVLRLAEEGAWLLINLFSRASLKKPQSKKGIMGEGLNYIYIFIMHVQDNVAPPTLP